MHGQQQQGEIRAGAYGQGQGGEDGHIVPLKDERQPDAYDAQDQHRGSGYPQLPGLVALALAKRVGVEVVGDRGARRQCYPGDHRKNGREGDGGDEAHEDIPAHRPRQVDGRHVAAAGDVRAGAGVFGVVRERDHRA